MYKFRFKSVTHRFTDALSQLSWQNFERLLATHYAALGYRVEHVGTGASKTQYDGGIDLKLHRDNEYVVVQCKHWNVGKVTHNPIHELLGVMLTQRATGAVVVTSGEFTRAARDAARAEPRVHLIDGVTLRAMLGPLLPAQAPRPTKDAASRYANAFTSAAPDRASPSSRQRRRARGRNPLPGIAFALIATIIALSYKTSPPGTHRTRCTHSRHRPYLQHQCGRCQCHRLALRFRQRDNSRNASQPRITPSRRQMRKWRNGSAETPNR